MYVRGCCRCVYMRGERVKKIISKWCQMKEQKKREDSKVMAINLKLRALCFDFYLFHPHISLNKLTRSLAYTFNIHCCIAYIALIHKIEIDVCLMFIDDPWSGFFFFFFFIIIVASSYVDRNLSILFYSLCLILREREYIMREGRVSEMKINK